MGRFDWSFLGGLGNGLGAGMIDSINRRNRLADEERLRQQRIQDQVTAFQMLSPLKQAEKMNDLIMQNRIQDMFNNDQVLPGAPSEAVPAPEGASPEVSDLFSRYLAKGATTGPPTIIPGRDTIKRESAVKQALAIEEGKKQLAATADEPTQAALAAMAPQLEALLGFPTGSMEKVPSKSIMQVLKTIGDLQRMRATVDHPIVVGPGATVVGKEGPTFTAPARPQVVPQGGALVGPEGPTFTNPGRPTVVPQGGTAIQSKGGKFVPLYTNPKTSSAKVTEGDKAVAAAISEMQRLTNDPDVKGWLGGVTPGKTAQQKAEALTIYNPLISPRERMIYKRAYEQLYGGGGNPADHVPAADRPTSSTPAPRSPSGKNAFDAAPIGSTRTGSDGSKQIKNQQGEWVDY